MAQPSGGSRGVFIRHLGRISVLFGGGWGGSMFPTFILGFFKRFPEQLNSFQEYLFMCKMRKFLSISNRIFNEYISSKTNFLSSTYYLPLTIYITQASIHWSKSHLYRSLYDQIPQDLRKCISNDSISGFLSGDRECVWLKRLHVF